jgi:hypothetical protein
MRRATPPELLPMSRVEEELYNRVKFAYEEYGYLPSIKLLYPGLSRQRIYFALDRLVAKGFLTKTRFPGKLYILNNNRDASTTKKKKG